MYNKYIKIYYIMYMKVQSIIEHNKRKSRFFSDFITILTYVYTVSNSTTQTENPSDLKIICTTPQKN